MAQSIGQRIRKRRDQLGMSRKELSKRAGLAYSTIADWEADRMKSSTKLHAVAMALKTSIEWLEHGRGESELVVRDGDAVTVAEAKGVDRQTFWGHSLNRDAAALAAEWMKLLEHDAEAAQAIATMLSRLTGIAIRDARKTRRKAVSGDRPSASL